MNVFDDILTKGIRAGQIPAQSKASRDWYRKVALESTTKTIDTKKQKKGRTTNQPKVGSMYMYMYDPKLKKTLPFYDVFPLIFLIGPAPNGFYGVNFHYLPPKLRARLMDALYTLSTDKKFDENTRLRLTYKLLKNIARVPYYKPTVKHYLNKHVKSNFIYVFPSEWDIALMLPTQQFKKASTQHVWQVSEQMVNPVSTRTTKKPSLASVR